MPSYTKYVTLVIYITSLLFSIITAYNWVRLFQHLYTNRTVVNITKLSALFIFYLLASFFASITEIPYSAYMSIMWRPGKSFDSTPSLKGFLLLKFTKIKSDLFNFCTLRSISGSMIEGSDAAKL